MAEFQEVMRQWVRARKATASNVDGENVLSVYPLEAYDDDLIASIEKGIMKWAAEHPVVYPTWWEWLFSIGAVTRKVQPDVAAMLIGTGLLDPIPADLAQKLGIEPKEG